MSEQKIEKVHCNKCLILTKHLNIAHRAQHESEMYDEYVQISWSTYYDLYECCGCESVVLRRRFVFSEIDEVEEDFYPPPISRTQPKWFKELPDEYGELLNEIYHALHADTLRLAVMGARTLIDIFMTSKLNDIGGFDVKLKQLETDGYISAKNRNVLDAALNAGHATIHRNYKPKKEDVELIMDIIENLIQHEVLEKSAASLQQTTPIRKKVAKK